MTPAPFIRQLKDRFKGQTRWQSRPLATIVACALLATASSTIALNTSQAVTLARGTSSSVTNAQALSTRIIANTREAARVAGGEAFSAAQGPSGLAFKAASDKAHADAFNKVTADMARYQQVVKSANAAMIAATRGNPTPAQIAAAQSTFLATIRPAQATFFASNAQATRVLQAELARAETARQETINSAVQNAVQAAIEDSVANTITESGVTASVASQAVALATTTLTSPAYAAAVAPFGYNSPQFIAVPASVLANVQQTIN